MLLTLFLISLSTLPALCLFLSASPTQSAFLRIDPPTQHPDKPGEVLGIPLPVLPSGERVNDQSTLQNLSVSPFQCRQNLDFGRRQLPSPRLKVRAHPSGHR